MRVSPALLASFSLVAIAGLPSQAADAAETANSATSIEAQGVEVQGVEVQGVESQGIEAQGPTLDTALGAVQSADGPSLARLLNGAAAANKQVEAEEPPAVPVIVAPSETSGETPGEAVDSTIPEPTFSSPAPAAEEDALEALTEEAEDTAEPALDGGSVPTVPNDASPLPTRPTPSAPNNAIPIPTPGSTTEEAADEIEVDEIEADEIEADEAEADEADETPAADPDADAPNPDGDASGAPEDGTEEAAEETRVLVSEVDVVSTNDQALSAELVDAVYSAVDTVPGRTTTRTQLQEDINNVFSTGFFSNVRANPEDTPLGVKITFFVEPNPVLTSVDIRNRQVLEDETIDEIFGEQYGQILNLRDFQNSVLDLNDWYQENGYALAQVTAAPQISDDGTVTLIVAEGEIESIEVRFIDENGETTNEDGEPITGKTRDFIVTREFETQPGDIFQESAIQEDIGRAFGLGIFEDIRLSLDPGDDDPRKVKMIVNIAERDTGSVGASLGFNLRGDLFGQLSYNEDNFGGNNQKLRTEGRVTTRGDFLFDIGFTDPWIAGDPYRTSYTASLFNRRATSLIFDNGPIDVDLPNGDTPRLNRLGTGISFSRPLDNGLSLSLGTQYERVALLDADGDVEPRDELGNLLTQSENGRDDLFSVQFGAVLDRRNSASQPTSGNLFRLGTEQTIPVGNGSIFYNKLRGSYSQYIPVNFFNSDRGGETFALNLQGGTVIGDLPPYEAFSLGGGNSVRGFEEGAVGAGRSFLLGTVEYRFPLFSEFLNGALFADYGTDLGTGDSVPGDPAGVRGKPGNGFGYGAGVRVQTPLGALRLDYGLSDEGSRFHFGFGERF
ncbi:MAG: BamA/TamA family outer membrane protein [Cyanobacteria bacterium J06560_5]